jgi:transposase
MYASLDLHKKYAQAVVMNEKGAVLKEERIESDPLLLERFSNSLEDSTNVVIESSSTWYWVYEILAKKHHVVLANPARTKAIAQAKIKTDKIYALTLANLLRGGYIAESYIPPKKVMELRELVRYRASLVKMRANLKNRIHARLLMNNIKMEAKGHFSKRYIDELRTKINDPKVQGYLNILSSIEEGNT